MPELPHAPAGYTIDVCRFCGEHAIWPFVCGHRSTAQPWTVPIVVRPTSASRRAVQEEIIASHRRPAPRAGAPGRGRAA